MAPFESASRFSSGSGQTWRRPPRQSTRSSRRCPRPQVSHALTHPTTRDLSTTQSINHPPPNRSTPSHLSTTLHHPPPPSSTQPSGKCLRPTVRSPAPHPATHPPPSAAHRLRGSPPRRSPPRAIHLAQTSPRTPTPSRSTSCSPLPFGTPLAYPSPRYSHPSAESTAWLHSVHCNPRAGLSEDPKAVALDQLLSSADARATDSLASRPALPPSPLVLHEAPLLYQRAVLRTWVRTNVLLILILILILNHNNMTEHVSTCQGLGSGRPKLERYRWGYEWGDGRQPSTSDYY